MSNIEFPYIQRKHMHMWKLIFNIPSAESPVVNIRNPKPSCQVTGHQVIIGCSAENYHLNDFTLRWYHKPFSGGRTKLVSVNHDSAKPFDLKLSSVSWSDNGIYHCEVCNSHGCTNSTVEELHVAGMY